MKWLIGIVVVMLVAHFYFRRGQRRIERHVRPPGDRSGERPGDDEA